MKNNIKTNFIYNTLYQLFTLFTPLITIPHLSRVIGAYGIGEYAYSYSIASYFMMIIKLGLNSYGNRTIAYIRDDRKKLSYEFWSMYLFQFFIAILSVFVYCIYAVFFSANAIISILLVFSVFSAGLDVTWFFWGLEEFKVTAIWGIISKSIVVILILFFVKNTNDTWKYTMIMSLGLLINQGALWLSVSKYVDFVIPKIVDIIKHIKPNIILFVPTVAISLYKTMDKIMLGKMAGTIEVGFYESSEKIIKIPLALVGSLGNIMLPRMSNMISSKVHSDVIKYTIGKSLSFVMMLSAPLTFGVMLLARDIVPIFYGVGFEKCIYLFLIILPSSLFMAYANVIITQYLIPSKKDKQFIISLFTGATINIVANLIMIPQMQSVGAALGTLLAEIVVCVVQVTFTKNDLNVKESLISIIPYLVAGIVMFICGVNLKFDVSNPIITITYKIMISVIIYLLIAILMLKVLKHRASYVIDFRDLLYMIKGI